MDIFEKNFLKAGRLIPHDQTQKERFEDIWCVWYREKKKGKREKSFPILIPSSFSTKPEGATQHLKKLIKSFDNLKYNNYIYDYECGLVNLSALLSNFVFIKTLRETDKKYLSKLDITEYVFLDTETTGFYKTDQVIDLAAIKVKNDEIAGSFQKYIIPTVKIKPDAQKVHGLNYEFLQKYGKPAREVYVEFKKFINDLPIVGHNGLYDKRMIERHSFCVGYPIQLKIAFDTQKVAEKLMELPSYKLELILEFFDLKKGLKSHSAMDDVQGGFRFIKKAKEIYKKLI